MTYTLKVESKTLRHIVEVANTIASAKTNLPILDNIAFYGSAEHGRITAMASDTETTVSCWGELVEIAEDFNFLAQATLISSFLRESPEQVLELSFDTESDILSIVTETGKYAVPSLDCEEFPIPPEYSTSDLVLNTEIMASELLGAIKATKFAVASDTLRPIMNGIHFDFLAEGVNFVATDAHKLAMYTITDVHTPAPAQFTVPTKPIDSLEKMLAGLKDTQVYIQYDNRNVFFQFENYSLIARAIEGTYPNYKNVIPEYSPNTAIIDNEDFAANLRRLAVFSNKENKLVKLKIDGMSLELLSQDIDYSISGKERMFTDSQINKLDIGFNGEYLSKIIGLMPTENVLLEMGIDGQRAVLIKPSVPIADNVEYMVLLMPLAV